MIMREYQDLMIRLRPSLIRVKRKMRSFYCVIFNGSHELYKERTDTKLYQKCVLCGHETNGWTIDRRDRQLHAIAGQVMGKE